MCIVKLVLVAVLVSVLCAVGSCQRIHYWNLTPSKVEDQQGAGGVTVSGWSWRRPTAGLGSICHCTAALACLWPDRMSDAFGPGQGLSVSAAVKQLNLVKY